MKKSILFVSNYYLPYISGVVEVERILAERLAEDGYNVKVVTSRYDKNLPITEFVNGVEVERCNVQMKISKGTVSIPFIFKVIKEAKQYDVVNMQLPMLESGLLSLFIKKDKLIPMYHCDINLLKSPFNNFIVSVMDMSHKICLKRSKNILVTSIDYASHSRVAHKNTEKCVEVGGPIKYVRPGKYLSGEKKKIGFCGRIVEEKGIDVLLKAFQILQQKGINAELLIGGDYKNVAGGSIYPSLAEYIEENHIQGVTFLGKIPEKKLGEFYSSLDVFVLPSTNSLEAFGLVQVEAMMCGTPVVSSDLYGVRTIIQNTGMGEVSKKGNPQDLAEKIETVITNRESYIKTPQEISSKYSTEVFLERIKQYID